jgi:NAD(P)-dependent dehydrogenase (short-subunit alcohol dehydrogenase family)
MNLTGISALVTGANRGLGHAFVTELLALGVGRVYAAVRRPATLAAAFPREPRVIGLPLDVTDDASIAAAVAHVTDINLLVNNAATLEQGNVLDEGALELLERAWVTNVRGPLAVTRAFVPALLRRSPAAALVHINSIAALCPFSDVPAYAATKAAALSLTQALRRELTPRGLPVYSVLPGVLRTDMAAWLDCAKTDPRVVARTVLAAVQRDEPGELFPDEGAKKFWADFTADPARTLFVPSSPR